MAAVIPDTCRPTVMSSDDVNEAIRKHGIAPDAPAYVECVISAIKYVEHSLIDSAGDRCRIGLVSVGRQLSTSSQSGALYGEYNEIFITVKLCIVNNCKYLILARHR